MYDEEDLDTGDDVDFEAFSGLVRPPSSIDLPNDGSPQAEAENHLSNEVLPSPHHSVDNPVERSVPPAQNASGGGSPGAPRPNIEIKPSDFLFGRTLGEGAFARVVHARLKSMQTDYAMKIQEKAHIKRHKKVSYVLIEKDILIKYSHPMIIKLYYCFTDPLYIYMCMDLAPGGELTAIINKHRDAKLAEGKEEEACDLELVQFYIAELVEALEYLHGHSIVHRDLKPENVLITASGHIKLADFGTALIGEDTDFAFEGTALYVYGIPSSCL
jgi:3-phosphoinositide dependent protein kinase-1